jgi:hypothetical protein
MTDLLNTTVRATHRMSLIATALIAVAFGVAASPNMAAAGQSVATAPPTVLFGRKAHICSRQR